MIISLTCPKCKEKISIVHGRLFHHRPRDEQKKNQKTKKGSLLSDPNEKPSKTGEAHRRRQKDKRAEKSV